MRVISRKALVDFWLAHPDVEQPLKAWFYEAEHAAWKSFNDVRRRYTSADALPGDRVVFNIKGNHYRLVVKIHFAAGIVYIRFIGTHAEYSRIDALNI